MVTAFIVYYFGVIAAMLLQITFHPTTSLSFRQAFGMLFKSFGSWITVIYTIVKLKKGL